jgi:MotA/TolQ/ExbB proton channel family
VSAGNGGAAAPLTGLLGTITGTMQAFKVIGGAGLVAPTQVRSGVAQALIATALGLLVASSPYSVTTFSPVCNRMRWIKWSGWDRGWLIIFGWIMKATEPANKSSRAFPLREKRANVSNCVVRGAIGAVASKSSRVLGQYQPKVEPDFA